MRSRLTALAALLGAATMTAQAGVLTTEGVTFTSGWSGNVLTLEIDAAGRSGGWSGATGLAALAIKEVGTYSSVSVSSAPGGTGAWTLSTSELKASGCSGASNGAAGNRMCFYGRQIALADDMVFKFTFTGTNVATTEPHVKVEFVDARGNKVGSLLSQVLPASPVIPVTPSTPASTTDTKAPTGTLDVAMGNVVATPAALPPQDDLPSTLPVNSADAVQSPTGNIATAANVPEPDSIALLLGGLGLMGLVLRRAGRRCYK